MKKNDFTFTSQGTRCAGSLYTPDGIEKPPIIILCHGLATERTFGLDSYVNHFVSNGFACVTFDYRCFGDSEGEPRNYISAKRHLEDIEAVVKHVKTFSGINTKKIGLWGSSYVGGHVLVSAANIPEISAVIAQVPFVSGFATTMSFSIPYQIQGTFHGLLDVVKTALGLKPHYVKVIAKPNTFALMNTEESEPGYGALIPKDSKWENKAPAKICFTLPFYMPTLQVSKIKCPVLVVYGKKDSLIPYKAVKSAIAKIKDVQSLELDCGHFDMYAGPLFDKVVAEQADFFDAKLK